MPSMVHPISRREFNIYYRRCLYHISMKVKTGHTGIVDQDVYVLLSKIPSGKVSTYGDIARVLGHPKAQYRYHVTGLSNQTVK